MKKYLFPVVTASLGPFLLTAQITSGLISFIRVDSTTAVYDFKPYGYHIDESGQRVFEERSDTTIKIIDGKETVVVINAQTYRQVFEAFRDTSASFFSPEYIYSERWSGGVSISSLTEKISTNYRLVNGVYKKAAEFRMYEDFRAAGTIFDYRENRQDTIQVAGFTGHRITYKEEVNGIIQVVNMYVTDRIRFPVQLFVHFQEDVLLCPLYLEVFPEKKPLLKTVWQLHAVTPVPAAMVLEKIKVIR